MLFAVIYVVYVVVYVLLYMCDARGATGEHHVLVQCAPPVSMFAKYLKTRFPLNITLRRVCV